MRTIILSLAISFLVVNVCAGADSCAVSCCSQISRYCNRCGARKICKVVCEMKEVKKTCWVVECEEFCVPLPGCGRPCKWPCGDCSQAELGRGCSSDPCASLHRPIVPPKCGRVRYRKKLVKKEITCEVPVYKCIVVCCNAACEACREEPEQEAMPAETTTAEKITAPLPPPR